MVNLHMLHASLLTPRYRSRLNYTLEGGAIESDGRGTMLANAQTLMALNRNGFTDERHLRSYFRENLGIETLHLLHHGALEGDDTDSHIDTLARLAPDDTILYVNPIVPTTHTRPTSMPWKPN